MTNTHVVVVTPEHLNAHEKDVRIEDVWFHSFKHNILSMKAMLNAALVIYQGPNQEFKILKNPGGIRGLLLNDRLLAAEGWVGNQTTQQYEKEGQTEVIRMGKNIPLINPGTSQPVLGVQTLEVINNLGTPEETRQFIASWEELVNITTPLELPELADEIRLLPEISE